VKELNAERSEAVAILGCDADFASDAERAGVDHAGVWETSYLWHLRPDCVDLSVHDGREGERLFGVIGDDPRSASPELGARACELIVAGMVARVRQALARTQSR